MVLHVFCESEGRRVERGGGELQHYVAVEVLDNTVAVLTWVGISFTFPHHPPPSPTLLESPYHALTPTYIHFTHILTCLCVCGPCLVTGPLLLYPPPALWDTLDILCLSPMNGGWNDIPHPGCCMLSPCAFLLNVEACLPPPLTSDVANRIPTSGMV